MAKSRLTTIIDNAISGIELQLEENNKHVIRISTIKDIVLAYVVLDYGNDDTMRCAELGLDQMIHFRLNQFGYRSVRKGLFVNLDRETNVHRLHALLVSAGISVKGKTVVYEDIKQHFDGQYRMEFGADNSFEEYKETMTEDEFVADLEADAI